MGFISTSVSGWEGSAALQIEPFGGEDDACEPFDRDRRNKGKYSGNWTNFLNFMYS